MHVVQLSLTNEHLQIQCCMCLFLRAIPAKKMYWRVGRHFFSIIYHP